MRLQKSFGKAIRTALLLTVSTLSLAGVASAQDKPHWDTWGDSQPLNQQFHDVCTSPSTMATNQILIEQENITREALTQLKTSSTAHSLLMEQGDDICISPADVPVQVDHNGFIQHTSDQARENSKTRAVMAMADRLINTDLTTRGYPSSKFAQNFGADDHFRRAVQLTFLAEIFHEMKENGNAKPLNRAMQSRYGQVFRDFTTHNQSAIDHGTAHMSAIQTYFKTYYSPPRYSYGYGHGHYHGQPDDDGIFSDNTQTGGKYADLFGMGYRPNKGNIFQSMSQDGFSLQYFMQNTRQNQTFHYQKRP